MESFQVGFLNDEQGKRAKRAVNKMALTPGRTRTKWDFGIRVRWPITEEDLINLEIDAEDFPGVLMDGIKKADDALRGEELGDLLGQLSLSSRTRAGEGHGGVFEGRLLPSNQTSLGGGAQDDDLAAGLEKLLLNS
jgi:hypothetical protein